MITETNGNNVMIVRLRAKKTCVPAMVYYGVAGRRLKTCVPVSVAKYVNGDTCKLAWRAGIDSVC